MAFNGLSLRLWYSCVNGGGGGTPKSSSNALVVLSSSPSATSRSSSSSPSCALRLDFDEFRLSCLRCFAALRAALRSDSLLLTLRSTYSPPKLTCPFGKLRQSNSGADQVRKNGSVGSPLSVGESSGSRSGVCEDRGAWMRSSMPPIMAVPTTRGRPCTRRASFPASSCGSAESNPVDAVGEDGRDGVAFLGRALMIRNAESIVSNGA